MIEITDKLTGYVKVRLDRETEAMLIALMKRRSRNRSDMTRMIIREAYAAAFHEPETRYWEADGHYAAEVR